jgi:hypothetical protein
LNRALLGVANVDARIREGDDPCARILAANTVLDRGYGKATQPIVAEGVDASLAHLDALREIINRPADTSGAKPLTKFSPNSRGSSDICAPLALTNPTL